MADEVAGWLDHRRRTASAERKPGTLDELAAAAGPDEPAPVARVAAPPRLGRRPPTTPTAGGGRSTRRCASAASGRGDRSGRCCGCPACRCRSSACSAGQPEEMGWGTAPEQVLPYLPPGGRCEILDDVGHFVHIEQPRPRRRDGARLRRAHAGRCSGDGSVTMLTHNQVRLALHHLRARATGRPLLLLHGLGEAAPTEVPPWADGVGRAGRRPRLHRPRPLDDPRRRRLHRRDAPRRRRHRARRARARRPSSGAASAPTSRCCSPGRGRPMSSAAILADGPGLAGGATFADVAELLRPAAAPAVRPTRTPSSRCPATSDRPTTPRRSCAWRWPGHRSTSRSAVAAVFRPPWLEAVADEPGVSVTTIPEALARYAAV